MLYDLFDSRSSLDVSKKWGMLALVNHLFKIYFKVHGSYHILKRRGKKLLVIEIFFNMPEENKDFLNVAYSAKIFAVINGQYNVKGKVEKY